MKIAGTMMAAAAALSIAATSASAQERTGMVTRIDRLSGTITIKGVPSGTVGATVDIVGVMPAPARWR